MELNCLRKVEVSGMERDEGVGAKAMRLFGGGGGDKRRSVAALMVLEGGNSKQVWEGKFGLDFGRRGRD